MKKISYGQVIFLLFICRVFKTLTFNPFRDTNSGVLMWSILISTILQMVILLPLFYIYNKHPGKSVDELAFGISKPIGYIITAVYALYFILLAARAIKYFTYFMTDMFPSIKNYYFIAITIVLVAGYGAFVGVEALGRSSIFISFIFISMIIVMIITAQGKMEKINLDIAVQNPANDIFSCVLKELGMNSELTTFALLLPYIKSDIKKSGFILLGLKLVFLEVIVFIYTTLLGDYIKLARIPLFVVGSYSKTKFIERFDALYMLEWTLCAALTIGLFIFLSSKGIKRIIVKVKDTYIVLGVSLLCFGVNFLLSFSHQPFDMMLDRWFTSVLMIVLTCILPLLILLVLKATKNKAK